MKYATPLTPLAHERNSFLTTLKLAVNCLLVLALMPDTNSIYLNQCTKMYACISNYCFTYIRSDILLL